MKDRKIRFLSNGWPKVPDWASQRGNAWRTDKQGVDPAAQPEESAASPCNPEEVEYTRLPEFEGLGSTTDRVEGPGN